MFFLAFTSLCPPPPPMIEQQAYILPTGGIDALKDTVTEKGITTKHLLCKSPQSLIRLQQMFSGNFEPLVLLGIISLSSEKVILRGD